MEYEKIYITENGCEYTLGERIVINDIRYLLLYDKKNDESFVAYEKDGKLGFIDENYPNYEKILKELFEKMNVSE